MDDLDNTVTHGHLRAAGWDTNQCCDHTKHFKTHFVYVVDYRTSNMRIVSLTDQQLEETRAPDLLPISMPSAYIANMMLEANKADADPAQAEMLPVAVTHYVRLSKVCQDWVQQAEPGDRLHLLLNIYAEHGDSKGRFRPAICQPQTAMLSVDDVTEISAAIYRMDRQHKPEWFPRAH